MKTRIALVMACTLFAGCAGVSDTATPPTTPPAGTGLAGAWDGTTDQNLPVHIRVNAAGGIDSLTIRMTATLGNSTCTATVVKTGLPVRPDGSFETNVGIGFDTPLRGRFTSAGSVSGSIEAHSGSWGVRCGNLVAIGTGSALPNVQWQGTKR